MKKAVPLICSILPVIILVYLTRNRLQSETKRADEIVKTSQEINTTWSLSLNTGDNGKNSFDTCGESKIYNSQARYDDLEYQLINSPLGIKMESWALIDIYDNPLQLCYSNERWQVIINIAYAINPHENWCKNYQEDTGNQCIDTLNIFTYSISNKNIVQAKRDPKNIIYKYKEGDKVSTDNKAIIHFYNNLYWWYQGADISMALIGWFTERDWTGMIMKSWYSDAWCYSEYIWRYDIKENTISNLSIKWECFDSWE